MLLPIVGTAYYNGFHFPPAMTASVTTTPVYDTTGRTVKYRSHTITIEFIVYPGVDARAGLRNPFTKQTYFPLFPDSNPTADDGYAELRRRLTESGQDFMFTDQGFGKDIKVNGAYNAKTKSMTSLQDVDNGPKPQLLHWEPIAASKAIRVVWTCTVALAECGVSVDIYKNIGEFSYDVTWTIAADGSTQRTTSGFVEVAVTQVGRIPGVSADSLRERLLFELPVFFRRESQSWSLSADRRTLRFSIVDQELASDVPFFQGVVHCDVTENIESISLYGGRWRVTIDGTITISLGSSRFFAWLAFLNIVKSRRAAARQHARVRSGSNSASATTPTEILITTHLSVSEEIFGRSMTFSIGWELLCDYTVILDAAGIWAPIQGQDWTTWQTSMKVGRDPRGAAQLKAPPGHFIVDFCNQLPQPTNTETAIKNVYGKFGSVFETDCPSPKNSWIFKPKCELIRKTGKSVHYPLGGSNAPKDTNFGPESTDNGIDVSAGSSGRSAKPIIQQRATAYWKLIFTGYARRFGFPVPEPKVIEYGGVPVHAVGNKIFKTSRKKGIDKCVIHTATWRQEYELDSQPIGDLCITNPSQDKWPQ